MKKFKSLFNLYKPDGVLKAAWVILRVLILPFSKLDKYIPRKGRIIDIGCGNGGFSNYISLTSPGRFVLGIDLSKVRINAAIKTKSRRKNIDFRLGNILSGKFSKADCYLLIDVLHHISFASQIKILSKLAGKLDSNCELIIKEVDKSNLPIFIFGYFFEKILYPKETIYARTKSDWLKIFDNLGLSYKMYPGAFYFPDSTIIFICKKT